MSGDLWGTFGVAVVGLAGVALGGLINLAAQRLDRNDKRDHELRGHVAEVLTASLDYEANIQLVLNRKKNAVPSNIVDQLVANLNDANRILRERSILLNITSSEPLSEFALGLHNAAADATAHFHPAVVNGESNDPKESAYHMRRLGFYREGLAAVARVKPSQRLSAAVIEERKIHAFERENGK